jgi:hypothetical protein
MIICDAIWVDPSTGKSTLLGLFDEIGAETFPSLHPLLAVHICMTDAHGKVPIKLVLVDTNEEREPLFQVENEIDFPDRRAIISMNAHMQGIAFPAAGEYRLQLFGYGQFMLERRLLVRQVES